MWVIVSKWVQELVMAGLNHYMNSGLYVSKCNYIRFLLNKHIIHIYCMSPNGSRKYVLCGTKNKQIKDGCRKDNKFDLNKYTFLNELSVALYAHRTS